MLKKGDCEDSSFLLATLLLASGISDHCVRVVLGKVISADGVGGHAWVVYQNENGVWCLLESTLDSVPKIWCLQTLSLCLVYSINISLSSASMTLYSGL